MNKQQKKIFMNGLRVLILEGTATASHFEEAIRLNGLTLEIIKLISSYYATDIKEVA